MILTPPDRRSEDICVLAIVIAELELGNIERHIFPAHFVECADYAALENRPEALNGLSMDCADDILASGMVNGSVREIFVEAVISGILIGAKQADFVRNRFSHKCVERCSLDIRDHARNHIAFTADCPDNRRFAGTNAASSAAAAFIPMSVFRQAADESFIDFDNSAELINVLHKCDADFVTHFPRGLVGTKAHVSIDLKRAHSLLANEHQMNDAIPFAKRLVGVLENRPGDMRKTVGNTLSAVHALPLESHGFKLVDVPASATRAADAIRPAARDKISATRELIREQFFKLRRRKLVNWLGLFTAGHDALLSFERSVSRIYPLVKSGIFAAESPVSRNGVAKIR
jgi:hypothetical protein